MAMVDFRMVPRKTSNTCPKRQAAVISVSHTDRLGSIELIAVTGPSGTTQRMTGLVIHPRPGHPENNKWGSQAGIHFIAIRLWIFWGLF